ncbi:MAG: hypothetical protein DHS80DRAFT_33516 [Piptocephalis tieghemiana]|nr:MAG: hypothetical protein DHS80DRAFT_33516 [Piptocephalis tieghemiana]
MTVQNTTDDFLDGLLQEVDQSERSRVLPSQDHGSNYSSQEASSTLLEFSTIDPVDPSPDSDGMSMEMEETGHLARLTGWWFNERGSPEVLTYQEELVEYVRKALEQHTEWVEAQFEVNDPEKRFFATLQQAELERARYILRSYLRARLSKLERYPLYYLEDPDLFSKLPPYERSYVKGYWKIKSKLFTNAVCANLPPSLSNLTHDAYGRSMKSQPSDMTAIFVRVIKTFGTFRLSSGENVTVHKGNQFLLRWKDAKPLMEEGCLEII